MPWYPVFDRRAIRTIVRGHAIQPPALRKDTSVHAPRLTPSERIVVAARALFFARGFDAVTTDVLAREAKVSKATLYKYFESMSDVLSAVIEREGDRFGQDVPKDLPDRAALRETLARYGENLLTFLDTTEAVQFSTLIYEEARHHPEIGRTFYRSAYLRTVERLAGMLRRGQEAGWLDAEADAMDMADHLVGLWEGTRYAGALLGARKNPFPDPRGHAEKGVDLLLRAYAP